MMTPHKNRESFISMMPNKVADLIQTGHERSLDMSS